MANQRRMTSHCHLYLLETVLVAASLSLVRIFVNCAGGHKARVVVHAPNKHRILAVTRRQDSRTSPKYEAVWQRSGNFPSTTVVAVSRSERDADQRARARPPVGSPSP